MPKDQLDVPPWHGKPPGMTRGTAMQRSSDDRAIASWRIVAGAFLHFVVPAYAIVVPLVCLFSAPKNASISDLLQLGAPVSGWFLAIYAALALLSVGVAQAVEQVSRGRLQRGAARDPRMAALASEQRVAWAVGEGRRQLGGHPAAILGAIRGPRWDHGDSRCQTLSSDLAEIVRTSVAALGTAPPERRSVILVEAATSLERIDTALAALFAERGRLDEGDARAVARYVDLRYGRSDFTGDPN